MNHCQICGRRKGLNRHGRVVFHYRIGEPCPGAGHPPIEHGHDQLAAEIERVKALAAARRAIIRDLQAQRVNWIDPIHERIARANEDLAAKLARRLKRHLDWPARFERQMETRGYGQPPPAYLLERQL